MRTMLLAILASAASVAAAAGAGCSPSTTQQPPVEPSVKPHPPGWVPPATQAKTIDLPGDANGCVWDAASSTLYLTDNTHDQIIAWTDAGGFKPVATLPPMPRVGLGGVIKLASGTFVTPSFGFGINGGVLTSKGEGDTTGASVPKLDPLRRRIGITLAPDGAIYVAYFVVAADKKHTGGVARLDLAAGTETDLAIADLAKPVGVVATDTTLYVSDQQRSSIVAYTFADHGVSTVAKDLPGADLLTRLPNGDFVTGGKNGSVYRIGKSGAATAIVNGYAQVRGTAYDPAGKRLFVVEHGDADHHKLHILPLEP